MRIIDPNLTLEDLIRRGGGHGSLRLDLGCGYYKPEGFIGLDNFVATRIQNLSSGSLPDIFIDLHAEPLPFLNESVKIVRTSHFLEHSNLDHTFNEVHRVLVPNGLFDNTIPYAL
jgi:predicted SAM-dependent methyltransferase